MQSLEEKMLLYRLEATQDAEAFSALYQHYYPALYRFILFRVSSAETTEDIAADVFMKLWQRVIERRRIINFRALAYRIARDEVVDHYRAAKRDISLEEAEMLAPIADDMSAMVGGAIDRNIVSVALTKLDQDDMELLILFYVEDLSIKDIATIVNARSGAVRVRLHRARERLRGMVGERP